MLRQLFMYWQFYDLKQNPFSLTPDPAFFFPNPHHEDALATLIDSLHNTRAWEQFLALLASEKPCSCTCT